MAGNPYELGRSALGLMRVLDQAHPHQAGTFGRSLHFLENIRGPDYLKRVMSAGEASPDGIKTFTTAPVWHGTDPTYIFHVGHPANVNQRKAIDPLAEDDSKDPQAIRMQNNNFLMALPEEGMILNPVDHTCAGTGPCVPRSIFTHLAGSVSFDRISKDLRNIWYRDTEGDSVMNPLEAGGVPEPVLNTYLDLLGFERRAVTTPDGEFLSGDTMDTAIIKGILSDFKENRQSALMMVGLNDSPINPQRGGEHVFDMLWGWPIGGTRSDVYTAGQIDRIVAIGNRPGDGDLGELAALRRLDDEVNAQALIRGGYDNEDYPYEHSTLHNAYDPKIHKRPDQRR